MCLWRPAGCIKFDLKALGQRDSPCPLRGHQHPNFGELSNPGPMDWTKTRTAVSHCQHPFGSRVCGRNPKVKEIAGFISNLDPDIPYSLLAFYPQFYLKDLPTTSRSHALRCKAASEKAGLRNVHIGECASISLRRRTRH